MTDQVTSCTVASSGVITAESSMLSLTPSRSTSVLPLTKMVSVIVISFAATTFLLSFAVAVSVTVPADRPYSE